MARDAKKKNVAAGLFENPPPVKKISTEKEKPVTTIVNQPEDVKVGRPRGSDLKPNEKTKRTSLNLTQETLVKLKVYSAESGLDSSQVIRELIRKCL